MRTRFISPFTDFGFKKLFGEDAHKELLADFLNTLMQPEYPITDIVFRKNEHKAPVIDSRNSVFDIYCTDSRGNRFIVEMQNSFQRYFIDRTLYYSSFLIEEQGQSDDWNYRIMPVYCVAFIGFDMRWKLGLHEGNPVPYLHCLKLKDEYNETASKNLTLYLIELPRFKKTETEVADRFDKWLYFLKNLYTFDVIPEILKEPVFEKAFKVAELAAYTREEQTAFERSLKALRDSYSTAEAAREDGWNEGNEKGLAQGLAQGLAEGRVQGMQQGLLEGVEQGVRRQAAETARNMRMKKLDSALIAEITGLSIDEIELL